MNLLKKVERKEAKIGVIGLGYVGLPLVIEFCKAGFHVTGFDVDTEKVKLLKHGKSYIKHIPSEKIKEIQNNRFRFRPTTDFKRLKEIDCIITCVPTPLNKYREPDLSYVFNTTRTIAKHLRKGHLIVLESTTYPGTTDEDMRAILEETGLKAGEDFYLAYSPEREDPNNKNFSTSTIPKVVGGYTEKCLAIAKVLYDSIVVKTVPVSSTKVAEATKLLENIYRSVNIALVNELKMLFDRMGINIWEVIEAAKTKPFGFQAFYPGPGLGGHCLVGDEMVWVKNCTRSYVLPLKNLFKREAESGKVYIKDDLEYIKPCNLFVNSINPLDSKQSWKPITHIFKRNYDGPVITVTTNDNRIISVTDRHPMLRISDDSMEVAEAWDLAVGDILPLFMGNGSEGLSAKQNFSIDLIDDLDESWSDKVRVRYKGGTWREYKDAIYSLSGGNKKYDYIREDVIPLGLLRKIERSKNITINHRNLVLLAGRGPSVTEFPAVVDIDENWARLIGYYLSEGCATKERGFHRIRITINHDEIELYEDIKSIASKIGLTFSDYLSSRWKTRYIRLNSPLLGWLLADRLDCGKDSYSMNIPAEFMTLGADIKCALLIGLFRGDGDVHTRTGRRTYHKNNRKYYHHDNSLTVGYFSINNVLFHQVLYLLQEMGICPSIKKGKNRLLVNGYDHVSKISGWLIDEKGRKCKDYFKNALRKSNKRPHASIPSTAVEKIKVEHKNVPVYSMEVADNHTFAAAQGIYVHNCIPIDPFYLTWKAREYGMTTRFIELSGEINTLMPLYVVNKVADALNGKGKSVKGSKILILGLAYKKDIDDVRESPSLELIELLREKGAEVDYNDPYVPKTHKMRRYDLKMFSVPLTKENLKKYDCVLISTDHSPYDVNFIVENANLIVDTRNLIKHADNSSGKVIKA